MSTHLEDIRTYLVAQGITETVSLADMADTDPVVTVYDAGGPPAELAMGMVVKARKLNFQIQVRDEKGEYATCRALAQQAHSILRAVGSVTIGTNTYLKIVAIQEPFELEPDTNDRPLLVFNVEAWV